jgi:hypothetical protein
MSKVTDTHPQYQEHSSQWSKMADVLGGADRMRASAHKYFAQSIAHIRNPRLYVQYVERSMFAGMTARTLDALVGAIHRKPPVVQVPKGYEIRLKSINGRADDIDTFARKVTRAVLADGRVGLLTTVAEQPDPWDALSRLPRVVTVTAREHKSQGPRTSAFSGPDWLRISGCSGPH